MSKQSMRAAVLYGIGDLRIEQRPRPVPGEGEVLLQVCTIGVCGSDLHFYEEGHSGSAVVTAPTILGHEFSGRIVEIGPGVQATRIGELVAVEPGLACARCPMCAAGSYNHCERMRFFGAASLDGAMQEYLAVPATAAYPVPENVSAVSAALIEPLSVALHALGRVPLGPRQHVLVSGAGPIGQLVAQLASIQGAGSVNLIDPNNDRLGYARDPIQIATPEEWAASQKGVDLVFECSGSSAALAAAVESLRPEGTLVVVGVGPRTLELAMDAVQELELTITGSHRYRNTWPEAIEIAARADVDLDALVTHRFPLEDAAAALNITRIEPGALKAVVQVAHATAPFPS